MARARKQPTYVPPEAREPSSRFRVRVTSRARRAIDDEILFHLRSAGERYGACFWGRAMDSDPMVSLTAVFALAAVNVFSICGCAKRSCFIAQEDGPTVTGTAVVETDGGTHDAGALLPFPGVSLSSDTTTLSLVSGLYDAEGLVHDYRLEIQGLAPGRTLELDGHARICVSTKPLDPNYPICCSSNEPTMCSPVTGSLIVRSLSSEGSNCQIPDECAQTIDATLDGTFTWGSRTVSLSLVITENGHFIEQPCPRPEIP